jgi:hypothetical protein
MANDPDGARRANTLSRLDFAAKTLQSAAHYAAVLADRSEREVERATGIGFFLGFGLGALALVIDALAGSTLDPRCFESLSPASLSQPWSCWSFSSTASMPARASQSLPSGSSRWQAVLPSAISPTGCQSSRRPAAIPTALGAWRALIKGTAE